MGLGTVLRWTRRQAAVEQRAAGIPVSVFTAGFGRDILRNSPDGWEVEQPWLWWVPPPPDGSMAVGNPPPGAGGGSGGVWVASTLPAVTRCTSLICDVIAGLPWRVLRGEWEDLAAPSWLSDPQATRPDGRSTMAGSLASSGLLPDARLAGVEFWSTWIRSALWWGDGYVYAPVRDSAGAPAPPLWILHPDQVRIDEDGSYSVKGDEEGPLPAGSVIHLRGGEIRDDWHGTGVLVEHAADLGLALATRSYAAGQYGSGIPTGYIESSQPNLQPAEARELQAAWMAQHGGQRRIAVLNATTKFVPLSVSPLDAQLDSARQWALRDIAMIFGLPSYMLDVPGDSSTYANVESRMIQYRMLTLLNPWVRRIESCLDAEFPAGTSVKIATAGLERADTTTRYNAYNLAQIKADGTGWMTRDEIRALEDLPPLGNAQTVGEQLPDLQVVDTQTQGVA
jgi:HK97 family phage portal protein